MAKKRGNNEGSIYKRSNGSWRALVTVQGKRLTHTSKTKREGQGWIRKMLDEIDNGFPYALGTSGFIRYQRDCAGGSGSPPTYTSGTVAPKRKFIQNIYYIRDFAVTSGDGIPTLVRSRLDFAGGAVTQQPAEPLVPGIERFRVELGIDNVSDSGAAVDYTAAVNWADPNNWNSPTNRGDGIPDGNFVHCGSTCTLAELMNVVSVKMFVLARSDQATPGYTDAKTYRINSGDATVSVGPFNDGFKRHIYSTTVRLNNVAGRRETP